MRAHPPAKIDPARGGAVSSIAVDARAIAFAVPFFFLLIGIEILVNRRRGDVRYTFHDAVGSLSCGIGQQAIGVFLKVFEIGAYAWVYEHWRVATISHRSPIAWVVMLLGVDLGYFLYHWASHRVNFLWATHSVHHQSEEYNLSTALRQSWFTALTAWVFYVPLAIAGFPPLMFVLMHTFNTLYQFWIHTRAVGRLGWFEAIFNTPSHHRVHHGVDPIYIDKNYAGIFIFWDKLFGTFQREEREPVYGTVKPLASFNPVWANVEPFARLAAMSRRTRRLRDKLLVWVMPPEWMPEDLGGKAVIPEVSRATQRKYDVAAPRGLDAYVAVQFALVTAATMGLLWYEASLPIAEASAIVAAIVVTLVTWSGLFEAKPWAVPLEWARLAGASLLGATLARGTAAFVPLAAGTVIAAIAFGVWASRYRARRLGAPAPSGEAGAIEVAG
jgi:alkylglycerol monooxygenase